MEDRRLEKAREGIFEAVRSLHPDEAARLLAEISEAMKRLSDHYDQRLANTICG